MTVVNRRPALGLIFRLPAVVHIGHTTAQRPENALSGQQDPARDPVQLGKQGVKQQPVRGPIRLPPVRVR